jgi:hypothetical protein
MCCTSVENSSESAGFARFLYGILRAYCDTQANETESQVHFAGSLCFVRTELRDFFRVLP